jgi:hypothetical protein
MPKIIIAGSRNVTDYNQIKQAWEEYVKRHGLQTQQLTIISGGANGADKLAERLAKENGIGLQVMKADWEAHGKSAGHIRNNAMAKAAGTDGRLLAYWDGESRGTAGMIKQARNAGLHVEIVRIPGESAMAEQLTL